MKRITHLFMLAAVGLFAGTLMTAVPARSDAAVFISLGFSIDTAPPPLVAYTQPECETPGYVWMPGFWALGEYGYYWVPGAWVEPPEPGLVWTPGYWGWDGTEYGWNDGYWADSVGFYGGINYGYGYYGNGFVGGYWQGDNFVYNTAVVNVNTVVIKNVYVNREVVRTVRSRIAFNGPDGIQAKPTAREIAVMRDRRIEMTPDQRTHMQTASTNRNSFASVNHGHPQLRAVRETMTPDRRPATYTPPRDTDRSAVQEHIHPLPADRTINGPEYRTEHTYNTAGSRPVPRSQAPPKKPKQQPEKPPK